MQPASGRASIVLQQATDALRALDSSALDATAYFRLDEFIVESLVISLCGVMFEVSVMAHACKCGPTRSCSRDIRISGFETIVHVRIEIRALRWKQVILRFGGLTEVTLHWNETGVAVHQEAGVSVP